jgi:hypothetical protein
MTYPDMSHLQIAGGYLVLAGLFVLREITSGALKEAGKDLWVGVREKRSRRDRYGRCQDQRAAGLGRVRTRHSLPHRFPGRRYDRGCGGHVSDRTAVADVTPVPAAGADRPEG